MAITLLTSLAQLETSLTKPFTQAGAPQMPTPAQMALTFVKSLPEVPAIAKLLPGVAAKEEAPPREEEPTREGYRRFT